MTSIVDRSLAFGPNFDTERNFEDPTLLSDALTSFFDTALSQPSNPSQAPSGNDFAAHIQQVTLGTDILADAGSDSARRDSLLPCEDASSPQTTSALCEPPKAAGKRKGRSRATRQNRGETAKTRAKREVNLEKNRLAANRCRKKKREWIDRLEDKHRQLSARNKLLREELAELYDTVYTLKELVLGHADCGSRPIDDYVRREAEQVHTRVRDNLPPPVLASPML
ncbi:Basic leucine zipper transcriptional factor ATF-like 3 [Lasiodiplodia theobromae]|uniref:Basic leucine zipper transcriptional factor ATF-like 3 n=1 Tax=Lasiodiplodia theobromae TaxID=45133 RepID=A0A5N5DVZ7_9PEZI|nr:Basic leucine zipper transcriptional factor ATF-like 3 [Lasiodiplodia theobromae]